MIYVVTSMLLRRPRLRTVAAILLVLAGASFASAQWQWGRLAEGPVDYTNFELDAGDVIA